MLASLGITAGKRTREPLGKLLPIARGSLWELDAAIPTHQFPVVSFEILFQQLQETDLALSAKGIVSKVEFCHENFGTWFVRLLRLHWHIAARHLFESLDRRFGELELYLVRAIFNRETRWRHFIDQRSIKGLDN